MAAHSRRTRWLQRPPPNGKKAGFTALDPVFRTSRGTGRCNLRRAEPLVNTARQGRTYCSEREVVFSTTLNRSAVLPAPATLGLAQYAIQHALAFSQSRLTRTGMIPIFCFFFDVQPPEIAHYAGFPGIDPARDSNALFRASISIPRVFAPSWMSSSGTRSDWARAWRCHGCAHGPPELSCWHTGRKNGG